MWKILLNVRRQPGFRVSTTIYGRYWLHKTVLGNTSSLVARVWALVEFCINLLRVE